MFSMQTERLARKLFFYRHEVEEIQEKIAVIRAKNETLIYNILPPHVAKYFIGGNRKDDVSTKIPVEYNYIIHHTKLDITSFSYPILSV